MKQIKYFIFAAAAMTLAACSSDDAADNGPVAAHVTAGIMSAQTRASGTEWDENDKIGITAKGGKTDYTNVEYTISDTGAGSFTSVNPIYFQDLEEVTFTAYYPYNEKGGILSLSTFFYYASENLQKKIDFMFAGGAKASKTNPNVQFVDKSGSDGTDARFRHCMSRLVLKFVKGDDTDLRYITQYKIKPLAFEGTFNTATGEATATSEGVEVTTSSISNDSSEAYEESYILFPQEVEDGKLYLELTLDGQVYKATLNIPQSDSGNAHAFVSGMSYVYTIKVNKTAVNVSSAVITPWTDGGSFNGTAEM